jgi:hypothetical protein
VQLGLYDLTVKPSRLDTNSESAAGSIPASRIGSTSFFIGLPLAGMMPPLQGKAEIIKGKARSSASARMLTANPAPLVEWKTHAALGRLLLNCHRPAAARESCQGAASLVCSLAVNIRDADLKAHFLDQLEIPSHFGRKVFVSLMGSTRRPRRQ